MKQTIIGRIEERKILDTLLHSTRPELLAIYGRRRIGKTYLIKNYFTDNIVFSCSGESGKNTQTQLINFFDQINLCFPNQKQIQIPTSWQQAFVILRTCLNNVKSNKKQVIFFDEMPWLDTHKSGFISAFGYFWNMFLADRPDILVIICGSSASWMIKKVVNNKGGLHNRITQRIRLLPFNLKETKEYLAFLKINLSDYQILQLYMVTGGIPHYLNVIKRGKSIHQSIDDACFSKNGALTDEFHILYSSLFDNYERHVHIITALSKKNRGLTRQELLSVGNLPSGGGLTSNLDELIASGFVGQIVPFNKRKKDSLYRLMDEFSLFYLKFMDGRNKMNSWTEISQSSRYLTWCGYAFENICIRHIGQIKRALSIAGVSTVHGSWYQSGSGDSDGAQIDLLIDRNDGVINIVEIKFSTKLFVIDKRYAKILENKMRTFKEYISSGTTVFFTFITTYGVADNDYKQQFVDSEVKMEALFS